MFDEIFVVSAKRTRKTQSEVRARAAARLCLKRDATGEFCCDRPATHRGRCHTHYQQYRMLKMRLGSAQKQAKFEAEAVAAGEILGRGELSEIKADALTRLALEVGAG